MAKQFKRIENEMKDAHKTPLSDRCKFSSYIANPLTAAVVILLEEVIHILQDIDNANL